MSRSAEAVLNLLNIDSKVVLEAGVEMPRFGLGTYRLAPGRETYESVLCALQVGYRLIDTASYYGNEADVGRAVRDSGIDRDEVFVTTKLYNADQGYDATLRAFERSGRALDLGSLDLYLVHWPVPQLRQVSWKALQRLRREGRVRSIGVSNYMVRHLEELEDEEDVPAVDQFELSPYLQQRELVDKCRSMGVHVQSYSPLARGTRLHDLRLVSVAERHGRTTAQVMLRWALQKGYSVIPRSADQDHIRENASLFDFQLSEADMATLDGLEEGLRVSWDPTRVP